MEIIDPAPIPDTADSGLPSPEPETAPPTPPLQPAGFVRRAVAFSIDLLILGFLSLILLTAGVLGIVWPLNGGGMILSPENSAPPFLSHFISAGFFLFIGYFTFFHAHGGQTPAKMIVRIKVVGVKGAPLTPFQALARAFGYFLSSFFLGFGFFLSIFEKKKRALHDLLTHTQVVLDHMQCPIP